MTRRCPLRGSDGVAPLELVLVAPIILALIGLAVAGGRVQTAQGAVDAAAHEAARQASVSPSLGIAQAAARSGAASALSADGLDCQPVVTLPGIAGAFNTPVGQPAQVEARVVCVVRLSDLLVPGLPGSLRLSATFWSPLDPYRSRDLAVVNGPRAAVTALSHRASHTA
jgi:hypothetical protein